MPSPLEFLTAQQSAWAALGAEGAAAHAAALGALKGDAGAAPTAAGMPLARAVERAEVAATAAGQALAGLDLLRAVAAALVGADMVAGALAGSAEEFQAVSRRYRVAAFGVAPGSDRLKRRGTEEAALDRVTMLTSAPAAEVTAGDDPASAPVTTAVDAGSVLSERSESKGPMGAVLALAEALGRMPLVDARYARGLVEVAHGNGTDALIQALNAVDRLVAEHPEPGYAGLWDAAGDALAQLIDALDDTLTVMPGIDNDSGALRAAAASDPGLLVERAVPHADPPGTLVAIHRRALRRRGERLQSAGLLVSGGAEARWQALLRQGREALSQVADAHAAAALAARTKVQRLEQSPPADAETELRLLRFAANALAPLEREPRVRAVVEALVAVLRDVGIRDFGVPVGDQFTEQHSASRFERRLVRSDRPKGEVVGVLQRGFTDRSGTPLQKAIVQVSQGP